MAETREMTELERELFTKMNAARAERDALRAELEKMTRERDAVAGALLWLMQSLQSMRDALRSYTPHNALAMNRQFRKGKVDAAHRFANTINDLLLIGAQRVKSAKAGEPAPEIALTEIEESVL